MGIHLNFENMKGLTHCSIHNCETIEKRVANKDMKVCPMCISGVLESKSNFEKEIVEKLHRSRLNSLHISKYLTNKNLENYEMETLSQEKIIHQAYSFIEHFLESDSTCNLLLNGPTGSGKTHIAIGILKMLNEKLPFSKKLGFISSFQIAQQVMNNWSQNDCSNKIDIIEEYSNIDVLVIDDFGYEDEGYKSKIINKILFLRHEYGKSTIITSNLLSEECFDLMDDRVKSRFLSNLFCVCELNFEDYRLKNLKSI